MHGILLSYLGCAPSCYLESVENLQKQICRSVVLPLLPPLNTWLNVYLNWLTRFHFLFLGGGLLIILIGCMIFLPPFLHVERMSMSTVSFLAQLSSGILSGLYLSGFKSRINRHLLPVGSF